MRVDPLLCSTVKSTTIIDSNSSIVETVITTSTQRVAYMDITVNHLEIKPGSSNKNRLYELQVKITCTISKLITIMLSQNNINVSLVHGQRLFFSITRYKSTFHCLKIKYNYF